MPGVSAECRVYRRNQLCGDAMLAHEQVDELICLLATWDRQTLASEFMAFQSRFPIDLTPDFLSKLSVDRLRHIFLAMCVQNQRLPEGVLAAA
jgi:hypothetical protein